MTEMLREAAMGSVGERTAVQRVSARKTRQSGLSNKLAIGFRANVRFRNMAVYVVLRRTSHNGHYLPWSGQKIIRNQESVAVRQIDLPSQLFLQPAFLSDICIRISDKRNCHCSALARYAGSHTSFMTKPALMFSRANQRAPIIGESLSRWPFAKQRSPAADCRQPPR